MTLETAVTQDIRVSVLASYEVDFSQPDLQNFVFSYRIRIHNIGMHTVKLLSRYWEIHDASGKKRVVEGPGVVGELPILAPSEYFDYTSSCHLSTYFGQMKGHYTFHREADSSLLEVKIPLFKLEVPFALS